MKKKFLLLIAIVIVLVQSSSYAFAKSSLTGPVRVAMKKYKMGNFSGCLQDCQNIIARNPSNSIAYYYLAMSYVQADMKDEAIKAYSKVLSLTSNLQLKTYATTGKRCLETPDKCRLETSTEPSDTPRIDRLIATPSDDGMSNSVRKDILQKRLNRIKLDINSDRQIDGFSTQKLNQSEVVAKIAQAKPSNDEVVAALKVLKEAGLNPYTQSESVPKQETSASDVNPYVQAQNYQSAEVAQLNMLMGMGGNNQSANNNNAMMNMLPYMMAQNKNGTNNYSPQMMQAMMMNSMMPDFNLDMNKDK